MAIVELRGGEELEENPHYLGHRRRLKDRFSATPEAVRDYELLEMALFSALPRRDVKPLAKKLLESFGSLGGVINAEESSILTVIGATKGCYNNFVIIREFMCRISREKVSKKNVISSWADLLSYLKVAMGYMDVEEFRILFLNSKNALISDEILSKGTINQAAIYPREIIKRVLYNNASSVILVHNHPSNNVSPSRSDIAITQKIIEICSNIEVSVHDHVIVGKSNYYSFKSHGLI